MRNFGRAALLAAFVTAASSCSSDDDDHSGTPAQRCESDADCDGGACLPIGICTPAAPAGTAEQIDLRGVDKLDLLLVVDNSISMADKQKILAAAVPALVNRLISPRLVDGVPEFAPLADIHIGIVSSSLGGHGADWCSPAGPEFNPTQDDQGHLIGTRRPDASPPLVSYQGLGFLAWDPKGDKSPPGETDAAALSGNFQNMVIATGERGCGFEAPLEAWYRFLIDPNPPTSIRKEGDDAIPEGLDEALLAQRRAFLRPDSLVAIVMLTDENDCSIIDGGIAWFAAQSGVYLPLATSSCDQDPNSPCCRNCGDTGPTPGGCAPVTQDPSCASGQPHDEETSPLNLRCWDQKRRFGVDFLYPTFRYVEGLRAPTVRDWRTNTEMPNPLYLDLTAGTALARDPDLVFLAGIVGVPWQDIATAETLNDPSRLEFKRADAIDWNLIVGDVNEYRAPTDALMIEDRNPRTGVNPVTGSALQPPSAGPLANPINGHEYTTINDLQYACIFDIPDRDCATELSACDCRNGADIAANKPLCQDPASGAYGTTQFFAKAYPGLRPLQVLKDFGPNSIVASICPKLVAGDTTASGYGYNAAVDALVDRVRGALQPKCLAGAPPVQLDPTAPTFGQLACQVVEVMPAACVCDASRGRTAVNPSDPSIEAVRAELVASGRCAGACEELCLCSVTQLTGAELAQCQAGATVETPGYCYVDAERGVGDPELVAHCPFDEPRTLRFTGSAMPDEGAITFLACPPS